MTNNATIIYKSVDITFFFFLLLKFHKQFELNGFMWLCVCVCLLESS